MRCPRCPSEMGELRLEQGVTVDFCAQCRAVWFDPGELAAMVGTREDLPALDAVADGAVGSRAQCPRCNGASLTEMRYAPDASPRVATCALCRGVMASLPDLPALKAAAAGLRRMDTALAAPYRDAGLARTGELDAAARRFNGLTGLAVKQRRRWLEMLTGWETPNEYAILRKGTGGAAFHVVEQTAGVLEIVRRLMLGPMRPFTSHVEDISRGTPRCGWCGRGGGSSRSCRCSTRRSVRWWRSAGGGAGCRRATTSTTRTGAPSASCAARSGGRGPSSSTARAGSWP
ncbi:MAG: phospholipid scramblase-related protein [Polyangiales bacterium]